MPRQWHINSNGMPAICRAASISACPLKTYDDQGNLVHQQHYGTRSEAVQAIEAASKLKSKRMEDQVGKPLNSLSRKNVERRSIKPAGDSVPLPPRPTADDAPSVPLPHRSGSDEVNDPSLSSLPTVDGSPNVPSSNRRMTDRIDSVPLPPRRTRTTLTASEVESSVKAGRKMAAAASAAFDYMSVPLPPRPTVDGVSSVPMPRSTADGLSDVPLPPRPTADGSPSVPMPRTTAHHATAAGVKTAPAGFLPGLTSREKNVALEGLAAARPDLSYEAVMGKPYSAAGYGDYVAAVEDRLKTDPDARAALSWSVTQALPPFPPARGAKHAAGARAAREKMWQTLS